MSNKEQIKDEIILTVKKAIGVNSYYTEDDNVLIDSNDIDHIAEQTAAALYNAGYRQIDENCAVITKAKLKEYKRQAVKEFAEWIKDNITDIPFCNQKAYNVFCDMVNEKLKEYEK